MLYHFYEWNHAAVAPLRAFADAAKLFYQNPLNPISYTQAGRTFAAMAEVFERSTRVYGKPEFGLTETVVNGLRVPVADKPVWQKPFARLLHFERALPERHKRDPRFLVVAPMSGHYATLLRGTVDALLPYADVYITDWEDARKVPVTEGRFDLDDYVDYVIEMLRFLGPDTHVIGVCQPAVPVLMAVARMETDEDPCSPATMTLMGGPIDTRINPTAVNQLAMDKGIDWFRDNVIMKVPFPHAGFMRDVYPGFLQLSGFMSMNLDRHLIAHKDFYMHLVKDDGDSAEKHRDFYDEYMAVMDLTAEFYLQTVEKVFIQHALPKGEMTHRGLRLDLSKIKRTALLTVEGENDDISGVGQTKAAQALCSSIPEDMRVHYMQPRVGHYGVFNGSRYRAEIAPRILDFALTHGTTHAAATLPRKAAAAAAAPPALPAETGLAAVEGVVEPVIEPQANGAASPSAPEPAVAVEAKEVPAAVARPAPARKPARPAPAARKAAPAEPTPEAKAKDAAAALQGHAGPLDDAPLADVVPPGAVQDAAPAAEVTAAVAAEPVVTEPVEPIPAATASPPRAARRTRVPAARRAPGSNPRPD